MSISQFYQNCKPDQQFTLNSFADQKQWVGWKYIERNGKKQKVPYNNNGPASVNDSRTFITQEQAILLNNTAGTGIVLGELGNGFYLCGIDFDTCINEEGELAAWATPVIEKLGATYVETSPSGTGVKAFFLVNEMDIPAIHMALSGKGEVWKPERGDHAPAIEFYTAGRYFTVTFKPFRNSIKELRIVDADVLLWLIQEYGPEFEGVPYEGGSNGSSTEFPNQDRLRASQWVDVRGLALAVPPEKLIDRNSWLKFGRAIYASIPEDVETAREIFLEASFGDIDYNSSCFDTLDPPHRVGIDHLIELAGEAGAPYVFTAEPVPPGGVPVWKSDLFVNKADLTETASALRDVLARKSKLFERGGLVKIAYDATEGGMVALPVTVQTVIRESHRFVKPWQYGGGNAETPKQISITLPQTVAALYLDMVGEWNLPVLNGTTSAPILSADGTIRTCEGFDSSTGLYCEKIPDLRGLVPDKPSRADAEKALAILRDMLSTFPFADRQSEQMRLMRLSPSILESENSDLINKYKDTNSLKFPEGDNSECSGASSQPHQPPLLIGIDESTALVSLLTAVCRPSIPLSPGVLITAPAISGAGTGKGLLARVLNTIAFGRAPQAFTGGSDRTELDKRIAAELIGAAPSLMLDNLNGVSLRSDILASAITERPARVRILGQSRMLPLNSSAFVVVTGNGLTVSEDLARRFIRIELDAGIEDPESRSFTGDLLAEVRVRRAELLSAALTIWRWGRQNNISRGKPLGSFSEWCSWVRDPLLALGCSDPVERIGEVKANDPHRRMTADLFSVWYACHGDQPMKVSALDTTVTAIIDPAVRGIQFRSRAVGKLVGTRLGGFTLVCSAPSGNHGAAYAVKKTS